MNQAEVGKLVSQLRIKVDAHVKKVKNPQGPEGRLHRLRQIVTGLFKHERIELLYTRADEARGYAERLISDAIRHGDTHEETMDMANYWLLEKQLIHKLFKVLVPRYENYNISYTRMLKLSALYPNAHPMSVLELRGNPYPPLHFPQNFSNRNMIHNVLLEEAKKQYRAEKYDQMAKELESKIEQKGSSACRTTAPLSTSASTLEDNNVLEKETEKK
ncbi:mitochondrial ribosomal protein L17 [Lycorma delicatula]|uniref:mitochondrial ribosomal protein L17 n=1 Tax=Lycorma delicatula TaxID=130591 RepID=UPI003F519A9E